MKKALTTVLICAIVLTALLIPISAKTVTYSKPSSVFRNSIYYRSLISVSLTGDERRDVIAIALSQLYYSEGDSTADFNGMNTKGDGNFTEYNYNYGKLDQNGDGKLTYGYPWCAAFVSFCLRRANISNVAAPSHVNCTTWLNIFKKGSEHYSYYSANGSYTPIMGDIVFYKSPSTKRASDHVGLVLGVSGRTLFAIEGNTSNGVYIKSYELDDPYIVGYAVPNYKSEIKSSSLSNEYVVTARSSLHIRSGPSKEHKSLGTLKNGTALRLNRIEGDWANVSAGGITGWISAKYFAPIEAYQIKVSVLYGTSSFDFYAGYDCAVSLSPAEEKDGHTFDGFIDERGNVYAADKVASFKGNTTLRPVYSAITTEEETTATPEPPLFPETSTEETSSGTTDKPSSESMPPLITESDDAETEKENTESGGCASSLSLSVSFILILGAAFLFAKKKAI